ncbi:MAG: tetratricopeptide repeat protein [Ruminococcus sp.]|jgi:tetratricopeptide (TPR) repeat protein|nr:tetratricopeptide repeat protein [Ruminococcus sp.]
MKKIIAVIFIVMTLAGLSACRSKGDDFAFDGAKAYSEGRYAEAVELFNKASDSGLSEYKQFELDLMLAESYLKIGNFEEAIVVADKVISENTLSGVYRALNIKGVAQKNLEMYDEALATFTEALAFDQYDIDSVALYNNIGNLYISMNKPLEALEYLNQALFLNPDFADTYGNIAIAYAILFDFDSAEAALADGEIKGYTKVAEVQAIIDKYRGFEDFVATSVVTTTEVTE